MPRQTARPHRTACRDGSGARFPVETGRLTRSMDGPLPRGGSLARRSARRPRVSRAHPQGKIRSSPQFEPSQNRRTEQAGRHNRSDGDTHHRSTSAAISGLSLPWVARAIRWPKNVESHSRYWQGSPVAGSDTILSTGTEERVKARPPRRRTRARGPSRTPDARESARTT